MVFFIIMFSDLECDYINPIDLCNKLNQASTREFFYCIMGKGRSPRHPLQQLPSTANVLVYFAPLYHVPKVCFARGPHARGTDNNVCAVGELGFSTNQCASRGLQHEKVQYSVSKV